MSEPKRIGTFEQVGHVFSQTMLGLRPKQSSFVHDFYERYFDRYIEEPTSGCWLWIGSQTVGGYGNLTEGGRSIYAHRASYEATHGEFSADGLVVRHRCDCAHCINPLHLVIGTHADNSADAWSRNRMNPAKGERHARAVLSEKDVAEMRRRAAGGEYICDIASDYPAERTAIQNAITGETWSHLPGAVPLSAIRKVAPKPPVTRGEANSNALLTRAQVESIKRRLAAGETGRSLAREFEVSTATISAIKVRRIWSHVA